MFKPGTRCTKGQVFSYSALSIPLAMLGLPAFIYLSPFYAETVGLSLSTLGFVLLVSRLWDMVNDPLIGFLSDKSGQRLPWILWGTPLLLLGTWCVFTAPFGASPGWLLFWLFVFYLGWTCVSVPYAAMVADTIPDTNERTRLITWRESFGVVGLVAALVVPNVLPRADGVSAPEHALSILSLLLLLVTPPLMFIFWRVWRGVAVEKKSDVKELLIAWRAILKDTTFRRLLGAYTVNALANALPGLLFFFFASDRLGLSDDTANIFLLIYFVAAALGMPIWLRLSKNYPKQTVWRWAMLVTCGIFVVAALLPYGASTGFLLVCIGTGLCLGADVVLPASLQTDLIQKAAAEQNGVSAAGAYVGLWGIATKLAVAGGSVIYPVLELAGYDPKAVEHSADALLALGICYAVVPIVLKLIAIHWMSRIKV